MTHLEPGQRVKRSVPSAAHDARKSRRMVVCISRENGLPEVVIRPARWRKGLSISVDALWSLLVKAEARRIADEKRVRRQGRKRGDA